MEYVLRTYDLKKRYRSNKVLNGVNMNIKKGDIYGFVGENGSGKTTVIRLITGLIFANGGRFELFGASSESGDIVNARRKLGAVVETPSIYLNMSAMDNLRMQASLLGVSDEEKIKTTLSEVGLAALYGDKKKAGNFSLGMRQRLGIAMALIGDPELLLLDEPMNGLDPVGIVEVRELIIKLNRERGITFLISSHLLSELSLVATRYGIISKGRIVREISAEELKNECRGFTEIECDNKEAMLSAIEEKYPKEDIRSTPAGARIYGKVELNELFALLMEKGLTITRVNCSDSGIEEFYLSTVGGAGNA